MVYPGLRKGLWKEEGPEPGFELDRVGRFCTLAGSEFQTDVAMGLKWCSPKDFELHLGIFKSSSN